ncbi:MAG: hypothetical protein Q8S73_10565 [Deltaproteobacteria bacterium]|nr:hypothetical protein [Myxococcales bacterium]MDP3214536.1 hypothetical protein [Deltaproteobacteria bacterium]
MSNDQPHPVTLATEKQASRDADAADLARGAKSAGALRRENGFLVQLVGIPDFAAAHARR